MKYWNSKVVVPKHGNASKSMRKSVKNTAKKKKKKKPSQPRPSLGSTELKFPRLGLEICFLIGFPGESDHLNTRSDLILTDE